MGGCDGLVPRVVDGPEARRPRWLTRWHPLRGTFFVNFPLALVSTCVPGHNCRILSKSTHSRVGAQVELPARPASNTGGAEARWRWDPVGRSRSPRFIRAGLSRDSWSLAAGRTRPRSGRSY